MRLIIKGAVTLASDNLKSEYQTYKAALVIDFSIVAEHLDLFRDEHGKYPDKIALTIPRGKQYIYGIPCSFEMEEEECIYMEEREK